VGIGEHLLLHDDRAFVFVDVFNRVFDGDDLATALAVDQVNHVVEGCRLSRTGWAGDQHEAARPSGQIIDFRGNPSSSRSRMRSPQKRMLISG